MNPAKWLASVPCKSLNENPRVAAEIRIWILENRRTWIQNIRGPLMLFSYSGGSVSSAVVLPRKKHLRASKLIDEINREIRQLETFLKRF